MVEGGGGKQFATAKRFLSERPDVAHLLLGRLADAVGDFLVAQVDAGAQVVQLFDSWAGHLGPDDFRTFALPYLARAAGRVQATGAPLIVFAPGAFAHADEIAVATGAAALGVDWHVPPAEARRTADRLELAIQGNLDPTHLYGPEERVRARTRAMLEAIDGRGYVANLGHGVLPETPVENVGAFIETVQQWHGRGAYSNHRSAPGAAEG